MRTLALLALRVALASAVAVVCAGAAWAQTVHPRFPVTDGPVQSIAVSGNTLYIAGSFAMVGVPNGCGVPVDTAQGAAVAGFPEVHGVLNAATDDGAGGWFIAGAFDRVGSEPRANLAHLRADLSVDPWNPGTDGPVYAMQVSGGRVFIGGDS